MHHAPSVTYPVGRCLFAALASAAAWLLGAAVLGAWALRSAASGWQVGAGAALWCAAGGMAALAWLRSPVGELRWTGSEWWFAGAPAHEPELALDLQRWMLLRVGGRWLWLGQDGAPDDWDALRRAVYSRANTAAPRGAQPPVA